MPVANSGRASSFQHVEVSGHCLDLPMPSWQSNSWRVGVGYARWKPCCTRPEPPILAKDFFTQRARFLSPP
jgi:hypothetical protein